MTKPMVSERVAKVRGGEAAPPAIVFRTWGIDLEQVRYGMVPRRHTLTKRVLHKLTPVQICNAHAGMSMAAMQRHVPADELRLMLVKQQRLMVEMAERLMKLAGLPYVLTVDEKPLEDWQLGDEEGAEG